MRIEGPGRTDGVRKNEKAKKSGGVSSAFGSFLDGETEGAAETRGSGPMAGIGSLLAAQSVDDPTEGKKRRAMVDRADKVLDALDDVHKGLLAGDLSTSDLEAMTGVLAERREKITDAKLLGILDEVDLRAQVELAKLEMARDKGK